MSRRRKKQLDPVAGQTAVKLFKEAVPAFEDAEKRFFANEKAKNRLKRPLRPGSSLPSVFQEIS